MQSSNTYLYKLQKIIELTKEGYSLHDTMYVYSTITDD